MNKRSISPYLVCGVLAALACLPLTGCSKNSNSDANASVTPTPTTETVTPTPTPTK